MFDSSTHSRGGWEQCAAAPVDNVEKDDKIEIRNSDIYGTVSILIDIFPNISLSTVLHRLILELMSVLDETSRDAEKKVT